MHTMLYGIIIGTAVAFIIIIQLTEPTTFMQQHPMHRYDDTHESEEQL